jgi:SAM-dependent methyltransferase
MGSQAIQAGLWGKHPRDWATIQEATNVAVYEYILDQLRLNMTDTLLDVGCGTGLFCSMALKESAKITGLDATPEFIGEARKRIPGVSFLVGELEELPFPDALFDVVVGSNSFQYAADVKHGLAEAKRVLKDGGRLVVVVWGDKEDCEAASYLKTMGGLMPPPPPGAPGPFALTENRLLENLLEELELTIQSSRDVPAVWDYENKSIALRGLLAAGPAAKAIAFSGYEQVAEVLGVAMQPYTRPDGHVVYRNTFRTVIAVK